MNATLQSFELHRYLVTILGNAYKAACDLERVLLFHSVNFDGHYYQAHMVQLSRGVTTKFRISEGKGKNKRIIGTCSCDHLDCLHAEAAFVHFVLQKHQAVSPGDRVGQDTESGLSTLATEWLATVRTAQRAAKAPLPLLPASSHEPERTLFYVLDPVRSTIRLISFKHLKKGGFSKNFHEESGWASFSGSKIAYLKPVVPAIFSKDDERIARLLFMEGVLPVTGGPLSLNHIDPTEILVQIAQTHRLISANLDCSRTIDVGSPQQISCKWQFDDERESWSLVAEIGGRSNVEILPTDPAWYFDSQSQFIGPISNLLTPAVLALIQQKRQLRSKDLPQVHRLLTTIGGVPELPPLPEIKTDDLGIFRPIPVLTFSGGNPTTYYFPSQHAKATISFNYQGRMISPALSDPKIVFYQGNHQTVIARDFAFETRCIDNFAERYGVDFPISGEYIFYDNQGDNLSEILVFQSSVVPRLIKDGWKIEFAPGFNTKLADASEWTLNFDDAERGWYKLRLDAVANGQNIDLIEVLQRMLDNPRFAADVLSGEDEDSVWWHRLQDGAFIEISVSRIRRLARLLIEIGRGAEMSKPLKISRFDVDILNGLECDDQLVVHGADHLFDLAKTLASPPEPLPKAMTAEMLLPLRNYQEVGVAWLRSRLALGLGVILGDDMAVGKTLQTLVHLWGEVGSSAIPSLIVVPMTLLTKWVEEGAKFIPSLTIHQYYGNNRKGTLQTARCSHVVLTTYQLLTRDIEEFVSFDWHIVACDEGHELRNPKSDLTRAVKALSAKQKIIITGTPLQNKPEDLWSVMDIAVPGLLRDLTWFRQRFVTDIQKNEQIGPKRLQLLGRITAPFRLSRSNKDVGNAIPKANEVIRHVDLGSEQRDIYEVVRATMDANVRTLIAEKGLAKNQITVLAAIGKLRQICCHPSLVKSGEVLPHTPSAKLDLLMEMAEELQAEGKLVVITSEWVEVLKIVAQRLEQLGMHHRMLIGTMSKPKRDEAIAAFRCGRARFLLMTLGVGGLGLDLPEGDVIIVLEPWWNPARIRQAIARLQRDDRDKQISAIHLIAKGTLEEGVMKIASKKGEMIEAVMAGSKGSLGAMDIEDIKMLLASRT